MVGSFPKGTKPPFQPVSCGSLHWLRFKNTRVRAPPRQPMFAFWSLILDFFLVIQIEDYHGPQALPQAHVGQIILVAAPSSLGQQQKCRRHYLKWDPNHVRRWAKGTDAASGVCSKVRALPPGVDVAMVPGLETGWWWSGEWRHQFPAGRQQPPLGGARQLTGSLCRD